MSANIDRALRRSLAAFAVFFLWSCSSGPRPPEKGSPAFYWQAAKETYAAGDFTKTLEHLDKLLMDDNEYTTRAMAWSLVLSSGLAKGYMELADHYEIGARVNKSDPALFRRQVSQCRSFAGRLAMQSADNFTKFQNSKEDQIATAFPYPPGTATPVPQLDKVVRGMLLSPAEVETAQKRALERGLLLSTCRAIGAPNDTARTQDFLKSAEPKVPRATFLLAMAETLFEQGQLFSRQKLDQPEKMQILFSRASDILKAIPETKEAKELGAKIQAELKKAKKS